MEDAGVPKGPGPIPANSTMRTPASGPEGGALGSGGGIVMASPVGRRRVRGGRPDPSLPPSGALFEDAIDVILVA